MFFLNSLDDPVCPSELHKHPKNFVGMLFDLFFGTQMYIAFLKQEHPQYWQHYVELRYCWKWLILQWINACKLSTVKPLYTRSPFKPSIACGRKLQNPIFNNSFKFALNRTFCLVLMLSGLERFHCIYWSRCNLSNPPFSCQNKGLSIDNF